MSKLPTASLPTASLEGHTGESMGLLNVSRRFSLIIRREGAPARRLTLPTLSEALEAAKVDASWLRGIGTVEIRPVLYVEQEAKG